MDIKITAIVCIALVLITVTWIGYYTNWLIHVIVTMYDGIEELSDAYKAGVKWAINEFQKSLCHPASEVPQIGRGRVLAYSIDCCYRNFYNLYDMMSKTDCDTYQEMWEVEVKAFRLTGWIYAADVFDLIIEGGNHD